MDTAVQPRPRPTSRRNRAPWVLTSILVVALGSISAFVVLSRPQNVAASVQDCTQPGKIGSICATVTTEHDVSVIRRYVTEPSTIKGELRVSTHLPDVVDLKPGDTPTVSNLCRTAAVEDTTSDRSDYQAHLDQAKTDSCDPAQKAKDAGDSSGCYNELSKLSNENRIAFSYVNIQKACATAEATQPPGKEALVDTSDYDYDTAA